MRLTAPGLLLVAVASGSALAQQTHQGGLPPNPSATTGPLKKPLPLPEVFNAQAHPAPSATPKIGSLELSGHLRGYDFQRLNKVTNAANPNRHALEFGYSQHFAYRIGDSPFNIGYTYFGATGFGFNGPNPSANPHVDNTLPGFALNQPLHEAFIQYRDAKNRVTLGDQLLNYPWTPESDTRIDNVTYQGVDGSFAFSPALRVNVTRILRAEQRNSSQFEPNDLLNAPYAGAAFATGTPQTTSGFLLVGARLTPSARTSISAEDYQIYNVTNIAYTEAKYGIDPYIAANPYLAIQYVASNSLGQNQIGRVNNHTIGAQLGANVTRGLLLAVSADSAPFKYRYVNASSAAAAGAGIFLPVGGTGTVKAIGPGRYEVAYGGIASPFTDSLGTDPLYTTQITQGMADRRSAGNSYKAAFVYTSLNKQVKLIASDAWFQYSNDVARNLTSEFDVDGTYFFNKVRPGPYKGFFARIRIAPRNQPTLPYNFEYQRFQTEYDF